MQENRPDEYKGAQTKVANEVALLAVAARQLWSTDLVKCIYTFFSKKGICLISCCPSTVLGKLC
jgi:hypothetical protein